MTTATTDPIQFTLVASKRGAEKKGGIEVRIPERYEQLPEVPDGFIPASGSYSHVAAIAVILNENQLKHGFLDYLYAPDIIGAKPVPRVTP